jgi:hypothetical protein
LDLLLFEINIGLVDDQFAFEFRRIEGPVCDFADVYTAILEELQGTPS